MATLMIAVPTRGYVWHQSAAMMAAMPALAHDYDQEVVHQDYYRSTLGVVDARNRILHDFRQCQADVLLMFDDDVIPPMSVMEIVDHVASGRSHLCASPCPILRPGLPVISNLYTRNQNGTWGIALARSLEHEGLTTFDAVGFGCVALSKRAAQVAKTTKILYDRDHNPIVGEDITYCQHLRSQGLDVHADLNHPSEHILQAHGLTLASAYSAVLTAATNAPSDAEPAADPPAAPETAPPNGESTH